MLDDSRENKKENSTEFYKDNWGNTVICIHFLPPNALTTFYYCGAQWENTSHISVWSTRITITRENLIYFQTKLASMWSLTLGKLEWENIDTILAIVVDNKLSFTPDPGVSCLLPAPMKLT